MTDQSFVKRTPGMFSSLRVDWRTPQGLFDALNAEFHFTLDVCANPTNPMCKDYLTESSNALDIPWRDPSWCNPPYGRAITAWVEKANREANEGRATVVCLLPSRTDSGWFHGRGFSPARFGGEEVNADKTEVVTFMCYLGPIEAGEEEFGPVVSVHDRLGSLHEQNASLLEKWKVETARADLAEHRLARLKAVSLWLLYGLVILGSILFGSGAVILSLRSIQ